jgi:hypothetical protein
VEDGVGAAAHGHVEDEGVAEGVGSGDVAGKGAVGDGQFDGTAGGGAPQVLAGGVDREDGAVAGQAETERLGQAVHAVGGEHA